MRTPLNAAALFLLVLVWAATGYAVFGPHPLPSTIPTHFDAQGHPNGWGTPAMLWLLPGIALFVYALMSVVARFPSSFNYPVRVTAQNRDRLQGIALGMIAWLKIELVCLFGWIQFNVIRFAREGHSDLSPAFVPLVTAVVFATTIVHIVAMFRAAKAR